MSNKHFPTSYESKFWNWYFIIPPYKLRHESFEVSILSLGIVAHLQFLPRTFSIPGYQRPRRLSPENFCCQNICFGNSKAVAGVILRKLWGWRAVGWLYGWTFGWHQTHTKPTQYINIDFPKTQTNQIKLTVSVIHGVENGWEWLWQGGERKSIFQM